MNIELVLEEKLMDSINEWFRINIQFFLLYVLNGLDYYVFKMEWIMIVLSLFTGIILVLHNKIKYSYRYEFFAYCKVCLFMIIGGCIIKILDIKAITSVFDAIFYNFMPITILGIILIFLLDKFIFFKCINNMKTEIRYLNYIIVVTYGFLLISSIYELKDIILPILGQVNLISIRFLLENKKNNKEKEVCVLYETRKKHLSILKDIIKDSKYEDYAIAINGEWGSGKSELIRALTNDCNKNNNYYVYIKPMICDTQESLIKEFQKAISKLLKNNGIYSGRNSSIDKYFKEILKLIQFNNKITLADFLEVTKDDISYKELKEELQDDIDSLLENGSKRIIVVIDDFDRVDESKQVEILSFIKEVIDFNGCITIIALDYENLKDNELVKPVYLEKFIATQLPLVDMEFDEIIKFHTKDKLNRDVLENNFSKDMLREINENIINYYSNIIIRINNFYEKENENINKSDNNKEEKKEYLTKFMDFSIEKQEFINNSRRVIHFLSEIQNSIILVDKLYKDRDDGQELLKTINAGEIIYFFNFIKVFYKEAYESIVKLKGIEEYFAYLLRKGKHMEKEYFSIILGDIVLETNYFFKDEQKELNRRNTLDLVKDIFINYHFSKNNIELLTNYKKCLNDIDTNNISIAENYIESIQVYQDAIFRHSNTEEEIIRRIKCLVSYVLNLYEQEKLEIVSIFEMATPKYNHRNIVYTQYYLEGICKLVVEKKVKSIFVKDRGRIESYLRTLESDNVNQYRYIFVELLNIATLDKCNDSSIDNLLKNITNTEQLFEKIKKYSVDNALIEEGDNITDLSKLLNILLKKVENREYKILDLELLNARKEAFLLNHKYIKRLKKIIADINTIYKYGESHEKFNIIDINQAKEMLSDLAKQKIINQDMMSCFQSLIKFVIEENIVDDEFKLNIMTIYNKMKKEDCWNEYGWFDIMINVERILSTKE